MGDIVHEIQIHELVTEIRRLEAALAAAVEARQANELAANELRGAALRAIRRGMLCSSLSRHWYAQLFTELEDLVIPGMAEARQEAIAAGLEPTLPEAARVLLAASLVSTPRRPRGKPSAKSSKAAAARGEGPAGEADQR